MQKIKVVILSGVTHSLIVSHAVEGHVVVCFTLSS
jgi:hypothetical protein